MTLYIGLMSGTSLDGMDGVLVEFAAAPVLRAAAHLSFPAGLREELTALNRAGADELHRAALAANALAELGSGIVHELLGQAGTVGREVHAIGSHGQTVRHRPGEFDGMGYTLQLGNPALLAERCGIDVVCDFRSRDLAAGGQAAPLVPGFHAEVFGRPGEARAVLNLGGIANLTLLHADGRMGGFDTGPANVLLDAWCARARGTAYDDDGRWAAGGKVIQPLLTAMLAEPFFDRPPPRSTGRDLFNEAWLERHLGQAPGADPADVQATLAELTATSVADALKRHAAGTARLLVCGGGAHNAHLLRRLAALLPGMTVETTAAHGIAPTHVEAAAFAWLAKAFVERRPGNRPEVTGARGPRILGALYPA